MAGSALLAGSLVGPAAAQESPEPPILLDQVEELAFDRPESWAMKYFAAVAQMSGLGTAKPIATGSVIVALEGGWVPSLSEEQRRVGFLGSKVEDLNRTSVTGRLRATFGLPADLALTAGVTPPVELDGVTPELYDLALSRPLLDSAGWRLGLRLFGQTGTIEGDLTCPGDVAGRDDPIRNPDDCREASRDEVVIDSAGIELSVTRKLGDGRWEPHLALSASHLDLEFRVDARWSVFDDRSRLRTDGWVVALAAGLSRRVSTRLRLAGELFYAPLEVRRGPQRSASDDGLLNARVLLAYSAR